uniref:ATP-dependent RNA helicase TDRD9 n=1 Tax=Sinocyclocheilus grahami TaxID=75366 RepID=A0A672Q1U8_SINGR
MHQAITSAQIAHWFTVGVQFANITITDEVKKQAELVSLIENNSVIIIRGATGSGKTTQLPQFILDHYAEKKTPCNLVVTQPRKIGATSIARWVARERKCTLGSLVGYQVGLEKMATEHTKLIYVTTGVLLQKLVSAKTLTEYSHIFIDEVHERTEELDFLLLVVRKLLRTNSRYVKVILMSATINCAEFAEYFGTPIRNQMNPAYVFEVEGAPYAIEEFYLDELKTILPLGVDLTFPVDPCITEEMYNIAISLIQSFDEMEAKDQSTTHPERGSVLVFLPGLAEIQYMKEALAKLVRKRLQVYPLHSTVTLEEQNGVFLVPIPGYRKIILSTNIAESSVTVPDVKYVIDFCLVRQLVCDKETNYRCLRITWASKTSCNQRRGRAGRVSKGFCYRLVSRHFWEHEIPDFTIPEMLRSPLASTLLKVKLLDMGDPRSVLSTALTPPNLNDIERTVLQLKQIGALSDQSNSQRQFDGELTFLGRVLAHLPVDLQLGKLIVFGHVFGCLEECLIIAASLSLKSFFAMPSLQQLAGYRSKLSFAQNLPSDLIAFVNAFKAWYTSRAKGELRHPKVKDELEWGKENCIQIKRIREVAELFEDLKKRVSRFNMHISSSSNPTDYTSLHKQRFILQGAIAGAFFPNYFSQGEIDEQLASKELSGNDPKTTIMIRNLPPFAFLCYKQLQSLFRQCGQVKSICFDGSRNVKWNIPIKAFLELNMHFVIQTSPFINKIRCLLKEILVVRYTVYCWSSRARNRFKTLTSSRSAIVSLYSILHGVMRVDLHISTEAGDVSVADLLVQEGYACHVPESFESQVTMPPPPQPALKESPSHTYVTQGSRNQSTAHPWQQCRGTCHTHTHVCTITMFQCRTKQSYLTGFTGALCGLGWNSVSQNAMLPEHDIELAFDVKFDFEDITEINALRGTVNKLVCDGPNGLTNLSPDKISSLQEEARERLVGPECTPVYYEKFKKWNQV